MKFKIPAMAGDSRHVLIGELRQAIENAFDSAPVGTPHTELPFLCIIGLDFYLDWRYPSPAVRDLLDQLGAEEIAELPTQGDCS